MQTALEELSKDELIAAFRRLEQEKDQQAICHSQQARAQKEEIDFLKAQLEKLRRMQFGQKRERFMIPISRPFPLKPRLKRNSSSRKPWSSRSLMSVNGNLSKSCVPLFQPIFR